MKSSNMNQLKLAELVGILLGGGSLSLKRNCATSINRLQISCNGVDDKEYIQYIQNLLEDLFKEKAFLHPRTSDNTVDVHIYKKAVIAFLVDRVGLKLSPKWGRAIIPPKFTHKPYSHLVLRGYCDTDGALVVTNNNGVLYPRIEFKICPSPMQKQLIEITKSYSFKFGAYSIGKGKVRVQLNGIAQLNLWLSKIGFSNSKHYKKATFFTKNQSNSLTTYP